MYFGLLRGFFAMLLAHYVLAGIWVEKMQFFLTIHIAVCTVLKLILSLQSLMKGREYLFFRNLGSAKQDVFLLHFQEPSSGCWPLPKKDTPNVFWSPHTSRILCSYKVRKKERIKSKFKTISLLWYQRALSTPKGKKLLFSILENGFRSYSERILVWTSNIKTIVVVKKWIMDLCFYDCRHWTVL